MNNFRTVYVLALANDEAGLKRLSPNCLDEYKTGRAYLSAAAQLAVEGEFEAVSLLIKLGANINLIARGAARRNDNVLIPSLHLGSVQRRHPSCHPERSEGPREY
jgi:hypothetical protein